MYLFVIYDVIYDVSVFPEALVQLIRSTSAPLLSAIVHAVSCSPILPSNPVRLSFFLSSSIFSTTLSHVYSISGGSGLGCVVWRGARSRG